MPQDSFDVQWYPYVSLLVKRITPSAVLIKDKVFITGGFQGINPQERELGSYLNSWKEVMRCSVSTQESVGVIP